MDMASSPGLPNGRELEGPMEDHWRPAKAFCKKFHPGWDLKGSRNSPSEGEVQGRAGKGCVGEGEEREKQNISGREPEPRGAHTGLQHDPSAQSEARQWLSAGDSLAMTLTTSIGSALRLTYWARLCARVPVCCPTSWDRSPRNRNQNSTQYSVPLISLCSLRMYVGSLQREGAGWGEGSPACCLQAYIWKALTTWWAVWWVLWTATANREPGTVLSLLHICRNFLF